MANPKLAMNGPFPSLQTMFENAAEFLQSVPLDITDETSMQQWKEHCLTVCESWSESLSPEQLRAFVVCLETIIGAQEDIRRLAIEAKQKQQPSNQDSAVERLLAAKSTAQRTVEWYKQGTEILTASQIATILKAPRTRGQLVLEKAKQFVEGEPVPEPPRLCCLSSDIRPFDWGIRFEPIAKLVYETMTKTRIAELGRLMHPTQKHLAASPDGLVVEDLSGSELSRKGRLVEFKAPISRKVGVEVPKDYYMQMQLQMEVADVELCDYFELTIASTHGQTPYTAPLIDQHVYASGRIYLIGLTENSTPLRYEYPPRDADGLNDPWAPALADTECILETIPWHCTHVYLKTVERSRVWFANMQPAITAFWEDVQKARLGEFTLPESSRKKKEEVCMIQDDQASQPAQTAQTAQTMMVDWS